MKQNVRPGRKNFCCALKSRIEIVSCWCLFRKGSGYVMYLIIIIQYISIINLLCVHVLVQTNFRRYYFYFFARSSSNFPRSIQRFRQTLRRNFNWIRQQMKNSPIDPHCKKCPLPLPKAGNFYNDCLWGNSLPVVGFE